MRTAMPAIRRRAPHATVEQADLKVGLYEYGTYVIRSG